MEYYAFSLVVAVVFVAELLAKGPIARVGRGYSHTWFVQREGEVSGIWKNVDLSTRFPDLEKVRKVKSSGKILEFCAR